MHLDSVIFYTKDIPSVNNFYKSIIGLEIEYSDNATYSSFKLSNNCSLGIKLASEDRERTGFQTLILKDPDIETTYQKMLNLGLTPYKTLTTLPYGMEFSVLDPDGNKVEFLRRSGE